MIKDARHFVCAFFCCLSTIKECSKQMTTGLKRVVEKANISREITGNVSL